MKIQKLSDSQLLWLLEKEDFTKNEINLHDFLIGTPKARSLFLEAVKKAEEDLMFISEGYSLQCQLQEVGEENVIFSITRQELIPNEPHLLCEFEDIDEVIKLSELLPGTMSLRNSLYKFEDVYLLFLEPEKAEDGQIKWCTISITEFADVVAMSASQRAFLREHGECIIERDALQKLKKIA